MSAELIATLVCTLVFGIFMFAGFAWTGRRIDSAGQRHRLPPVRVRSRLDGIDARLDALTRELAEVRKSVTRVEGSQRHR